MINIIRNDPVKINIYFQTPYERLINRITTVHDQVFRLDNDRVKNLLAIRD